MMESIFSFGGGAGNFPQKTIGRFWEGVKESVKILAGKQKSGKHGVYTRPSQSNEGWVENIPNKEEGSLTWAGPELVRTTCNWGGIGSGIFRKGNRELSIN